MRRYGQQTQGVTVPGRDAGLKLTLQPTAEPVEPVEPAPECAPAISGLFWFSDSSGLFDQDVEAAYLLAEGAAGPVLGMAALVGESCDLPVTWTKTWTPASGTGGDPGYLEDGARLVVYPLADTVPGVLEVTAEHDGKSYGPIVLTIEMYSPVAWVQIFDIDKLSFSSAIPPRYSWDSGQVNVTYDGRYYIYPTAGSGWEAGFRPTKARISVQIDFAPAADPVVFEIKDAAGNSLGSKSTSMSAGNSYQVEIDLSFASDDIAQIIVAGPSVSGGMSSLDGTNKITNIEFLE